MKNIVLFHAFKHHFLYNVEWLKEDFGKWNEENNLLLKSIGASQLDYYIGTLSAKNIEQEVEDFLEENNLLNKEYYKQWIHTGKGFREITLSDQSVWTLRMVDKDTFVHIHPSRYSPNTIRIKANILKTVLCVCLFEDTLKTIPDIRLINMYRTEYLNLSPITPNSIHTELNKVFNLFYNHY